MIIVKEGEDMIKTHEAEEIDIDSLKFDETNPNQLSQEQMHGLRKSMETYGYLTPIVVDQNNLIADGEHRVLVYKEFGINKILAYRLHFDTDAERKMLRQTMNKLRGEHDFQKDVAEIFEIMQAGHTEDLAALIAQSSKSLEYLSKQFQEQNDNVLKAITDEDIKTENECPKCHFRW